MESATSDDNHKLIASFLEIAGQTMETAILFLKATRWNLEEAINLSLIRKPTSREIWDSTTPEPSDSAFVGPDMSLSSLYRPPLKLLCKGSFEYAKITSCWKNEWLLVNLQSTTEFASHTLNRDVWSNEAVSQFIESRFILWQVYDDTTEGQKISTFYNIESAPPVVLLIDPITGQKMHSWSGAIEAQGFVEDLMKYIDFSPREHYANNIKTEKFTFQYNKADDKVMATFSDNDYKESSEGKILNFPEKEETCSSSDKIDHIVAPSLGEEFEDSAEVMEEEETLLLDLTEEPNISRCEKKAEELSFSIERTDSASLVFL